MTHVEKADADDGYDHQFIISADDVEKTCRCKKAICQSCNM